MLEKKLARPFFVGLKVVFVADGEEVEDGVEFEKGRIMLLLELEGAFFLNATGYIIYATLNSWSLPGVKHPAKGAKFVEFVG